MDKKRNLILIKGENKTWQIERCCYDPKDQRYHVTFHLKVVGSCEIMSEHNEFGIANRELH